MDPKTSDLFLVWTEIPSNIHRKLYEKADLVEMYSYNEDFTAGYLAAMETAHLCVSEAVMEVQT